MWVDSTSQFRWADRQNMEQPLGEIKKIQSIRCTLL